MLFYEVFFFKQKTAYEMRISDWSSDVCSSDLRLTGAKPRSSETAKRRPSRAAGLRPAKSAPRVKPDSGSRASPPASASRNSARSATLRAIGPSVHIGDHAISLRTVGTTPGEIGRAHV